MKICNNFFVIIFTIVLCSCASFKSTKLSADQVKITTDNLELLNGTYYKIPSSEPQTGDVFWRYSSSIFSKDTNGDSFYYIDLLKIGDRRLKIRLLNSNYKVLKSSIFTGRIKNGYFITNGRIIFAPYYC